MHSLFENIGSVGVSDESTATLKHRNIRRELKNYSMQDIFNVSTEWFALICVIQNYAIYLLSDFILLCHVAFITRKCTVTCTNLLMFRVFRLFLSLYRIFSRIFPLFEHKRQHTKGNFNTFRSFNSSQGQWKGHAFQKLHKYSNERLRIQQHCRVSSNVLEHKPFHFSLRDIYIYIHDFECDSSHRAYV